MLFVPTFNPVEQGNGDVPPPSSTGRTGLLMPSMHDAHQPLHGFGMG
jgi:hypothetical protein